MNSFNIEEFEELKKITSNEIIKDAVVNIESEEFFRDIKNFVKKDRRGEVVFAVERPNGKIVAITCTEYPEGIYRIPTGGINHNEDILKSLYREINEELGVIVELVNFIGVLKQCFKYNEEEIYFYSYLFHLKEIGGRILIDALEDEVSDIMECTKEDLLMLCDRLKNIDESRLDWGKFRYNTTNAVADYFFAK